jgi:hypothetical protein
MKVHSSNNDTLELMAENITDEKLLLKLSDANIYGNFNMGLRRSKLVGLTSPYFDNTAILTIHINAFSDKRGI